jgi:glutathione peroxidase-family protein
MNVNYPGLRYLLEKYEDFEVVCVPCNQFGGQAPGTSQEERQAAINKFGINVTVVDKELVNGPNAHPLYAYLKAQQPISFPNAAGRTTAASLSKDQGAIEWNYTKFLVDRQGIPVKRFKSAYDPLEFEGDVRLLLEGMFGFIFPCQNISVHFLSVGIYLMICNCLQGSHQHLGNVLHTLEEEYAMLTRYSPHQQRSSVHNKYRKCMVYDEVQKHVGPLRDTHQSVIRLCKQLYVYSWTL